MMMVGVGDDDVKSGCATRRTKNEYRRNVTQHAVENRMDRWSKGAPSQLRFTRLRIIKFNIIFRKVIVVVEICVDDGEEETETVCVSVELQFEFNDVNDY